MPDDQSDLPAPVGAKLFSHQERRAQFIKLKAKLEEAVAEVEAGAFDYFDPKVFEADAFL